MAARNDLVTTAEGSNAAVKLAMRCYAHFDGRDGRCRQQCLSGDLLLYLVLERLAELEVGGTGGWRSWRLVEREVGGAGGWWSWRLVELVVGGLEVGGVGGWLSWKLAEVEVGGGGSWRHWRLAELGVDEAGGWWSWALTELEVGEAVEVAGKPELETMIVPWPPGIYMPPLYTRVGGGPANGLLPAA
ncbi:hypothetical protein Q1695_007090 [Nippostrongylus brasiliensis]|nr:hypothetical protein Q1695_007090 [Nippostrongylus brasiliensis]